jgi:hypothetical protein
MNKADLQKILLEEIETAINEEELDEQSFLKRVASAMKRTRRGDERRAQRAKARRKGADTVDDAGEAPEDVSPPKPAAKETKTVSLFKDIMPEVIDDHGRSTEQKIRIQSKFTKLGKALKRNRMLGREISSSKREEAEKRRLAAAKNIESLKQAMNRAIEKESRKAYKANADMGSYKTPEEAKRKVSEELAKLFQDEAIVNQILTFIDDDMRLTESLLTRVVLENLKGNKVVL